MISGVETIPKAEITNPIMDSSSMAHRRILSQSSGQSEQKAHFLAKYSSNSAKTGGGITKHVITIGE